MDHCIMIGVDVDHRGKTLLQRKLEILVHDGVEVIVLYSFARGCFYIRILRVSPDCEVIRDLFARGFEFCEPSEAMMPGLHPVPLDDLVDYKPEIITSCIEI